MAVTIVFCPASSLSAFPLTIFPKPSSGLSCSHCSKGTSLEATQAWFSASWKNRLDVYMRLLSARRLPDRCLYAYGSMIFPLCRAKDFVFPKQPVFPACIRASGNYVPHAPGAAGAAAH